LFLADEGMVIYGVADNSLFLADEGMVIYGVAGPFEA